MVSWDKIQVKLQNCHLLFSILLEVDAKAQFNVRQLNAFLAGYGIAQALPGVFFAAYLGVVKSG
jgi:hypothetical protein